MFIFNDYYKEAHFSTWIRDSGQSEIADLEIASCVQQEVRRLEIAVQHVGRVDVLQTAKDLVEKVTDVVVAQSLKKKNKNDGLQYLNFYFQDYS